MINYRTTNEKGQPIRKIVGTFSFILEESDQRCGEMELTLATDSGDHFLLPPVYNFYDTLNEICRSEPKTMGELIELVAAINVSPEMSASTYQQAYDEFMERKYPGWKGLVEKSRRPYVKAPPEQHKITTTTAKDLGL